MWFNEVHNCRVWEGRGKVSSSYCVASRFAYKAENTGISYVLYVQQHYKINISNQNFIIMMRKLSVIREISTEK